MSRLAALLEFSLQRCLDVVLYLDLSHVGIIAREAENQVVVARRKRQRGGGLPRLLRAIDENVRPGGFAGDVDTLGECVKMNFLILRLAGFDLERGLYLQVTILLNL